MGLSKLLKSVHHAQAELVRGIHGEAEGPLYDFAIGDFKFILVLPPRVEVWIRI